jgi:hypothetical protein
MGGIGFTAQQGGNPRQCGRQRESEDVTRSSKGASENHHPENSHHCPTP